MRLTFDDLLDAIAGYAGKDVSKSGTSAVRRAAQAGIREMQGHHDWTYYRTLGRIVTVASYNTGTIEYDHTGGANERQVTLTTGTWPSWAASGFIVIDDVAYEVATRVSNSIITLGTAQNPGADVAAGETYLLAQDTYSLPSDFGKIGDTVVGNDVGPLVYCDPREMVLARRSSISATGRPSHFSVVGNPSNDGTIVMKLWPATDAVYAIDFDYKRRPTEVTVDGVKAGSASITSSSTTVTGVGTSFHSRMEGSIFRISYNATEYPTGLSGNNPAAFEAVISTVASATSLTMETAADQTLSGMKYMISDPIDVEPGTMETALYRLCENAMRQVARMEPIAGELGEMKRALAAARDDDSRYYGNREARRAIYGRRIDRGPLGVSDSVSS